MCMCVCVCVCMCTRVYIHAHVCFVKTVRNKNAKSLQVVQAFCVRVCVLACMCVCICDEYGVQAIYITMQMCM